MALTGTRKKTLQKKRRGKRAVFLVRVKRFGLIFGAFVLTLWVGAWLHFSDSFTKAAHWTKQEIITASADLGFVTQNILVEGRVNTDADVLRALINVGKGDPLFSFDPSEAQSLIERIAWVRSAHVERQLPGTIYIGLEERRPLALYQESKKLSLLDERGDVITRDGLSKFKDLVIVMGKGSPERAPGFFKNLEAEPVLFERARSAKWIDERRWDLRMAGGAVVKLPEGDLGLALRRLAVAQEDDGLLDKGLASIDLREADRIVVRTKPGAVQEYKAGYVAGSKSGNNI